MKLILQPWQLSLLILASWINRKQLSQVGTLFELTSFIITLNGIIRV